ncbi:hypothetical protein MWN34_01650 [Ancylobacter sp. 6x-1]|uniref:IPT/TIG domain-containing protein n=1 Tax=Ancylobacter crimeensis TaxID=2579147 RepID=A0ABT0D6N8_9HYPH|nr:hypothetical protein [Ancylobacter crimeensis]MCK0195610.1 hypothetical protein [Ancylobacter crimeensis]
MSWKPSIKAFFELLIASTLLLPAAANAKPSIFWANDPVEPDDTVVITGSGFTPASSVEITPLPSTPDRSAPTTAGRSVPLDEVSDTAISFVVPGDLPKGAYTFTIRSPDGDAYGRLNTPTVYWSQADRGASATPGGWIRVLGRNIARTADARLELTDADGRTHLLKPAAPDIWDARFTLPADVAAGTYALRLWNGNGDSNTWQTLGSLRVALPNKPSPAVVVVPPPSAPAKDARDAGPIMDALAAVAAKGGGTVRLSAGNYRLAGMIEIPDNVALRGASTDTTVLTWTDDDNPPDAMIRGKSGISLSDLTIVATRHNNIVEAGASPPPAGNVGSGAQVAPDPDADAHDVTIERVRIRASAFRGHVSPDEVNDRLKAMLTRQRGGAIAVLAGGRNLRIVDCDIMSSMRALVLLRPQDAYIGSNRFTNGRKGWYSISSGHRVIFENNEINGGDLQASGGGINTMFTGEPSSEFVLMKNNTLRDIYGWDREAMTTDGPGGFYFGKAVAGETNQLTLTDDIPPNQRFTTWRGSALYVVAGRGMGQYARVKEQRGAAVDLDRPLPIAPDGSSIISIVPAQERYLILHNRFVDAGALQVFGTSMDIVIAGNTFVRSDGIRIRGLYYGMAQPAWYGQILGNRIESANPLAPTVIEIAAGPKKDSTIAQTLTYGMIVRDNALSFGTSIILATRPHLPASAALLAVEHNEMPDPHSRIMIEGPVGTPMVRANVSRKAEQPIP